MAKISIGAGYLFTLGNNPWIDGITYNAKWGTSSLVPTKLAISILQPEDQSRYDLDSMVWYQARANSGQWIQDGNPIGKVSKAAQDAIKLSYQAWEDVANIQFDFIKDPTQSDVFITLARYANEGRDDKGTLLGSHRGLLSLRQIFETVEQLGVQLERPTLIGTEGVASPTPLVMDLNYDVYKNDGPSDSEFIETIVHEIGHGIGMSHPHDPGLGSVPSGVFPGIQAGDSFAFNGTGLYGLNENVYTVMSYNTDVESAGDPDRVHAVTPMALELLGAQIKYGTNRSTRTGNDIYSLYQQTRPGSKAWTCIWDAGGIDTISAKELKVDTVISLRPAEMNTEQPETGMPQEQYSWVSPWSNSALALDFLVNAKSSQPGALLGSGMKLAYTTNVALSEIDGIGRFLGQDVATEFRSRLQTLGASLETLYETYGFNGTYNLLVTNESLPSDASEEIKLAATQAKEVLQDIDNNMNKPDGLFLFLNPGTGVLTNFLQTSQFAEISLADYYEGLNEVVDLQSEVQVRSAKGVAGYISEIARSAVDELPASERPGGGFTIAAGVTIEKAIGGSGNDHIVGNAANNVLRGMKGDDLIRPYIGSNKVVGGAGIDTVDFNTGIGRLRFKDLSFEQDGDWLKVTMAGSGDINALKGVEQIVVGNTTYAVDSLLSA